LTDEYMKALKELKRCRTNYDEITDDFEGVAFRELQAAEERVMAIIRERKVK